MRVAGGGRPRDDASGRPLRGVIVAEAVQLGEVDRLHAVIVPDQKHDLLDAVAIGEPPRSLGEPLVRSLPLGDPLRPQGDDRPPPVGPDSPIRGRPMRRRLGDSRMQADQVRRRPVARVPGRWASLASVAAADPYMTITEPTFVARFLLDPQRETEESVANLDAIVDLPDGSSWALTILTVDDVRRLLAKWQETGEAGCGSYFWAVDQLIVPEPGVPGMIRAIRELVRIGEIASVAVRCETPDR